MNARNLMWFAASVSLLLAAGCRTYTLPEIERPHHVKLWHVACQNVATVSEPEALQKFDEFVSERKSGWRYWRITYFGFFQNAFPYFDIMAYDTRSNFIYAVGVDQKQITFRDRAWKKTRRKEATRVEHDRLLEIVGTSDTELEEMVRAIGETENRMKPVVAALKRYKQDVGRYPSNEEGIEALLRDPGAPHWNGPYLAEVPVDAWGTPFRYYETRYESGPVEVVFQTIWSAGHDRKFGSASHGIGENDVRGSVDFAHEPIQKR